MSVLLPEEDQAWQAEVFERFVLDRRKQAKGDLGSGYVSSLRHGRLALECGKYIGPVSPNSQWSDVPRKVTEKPVTVFTPLMSCLILSFVQIQVR